MPQCSYYYLVAGTKGLRLVGMVFTRTRTIYGNQIVEWESRSRDIKMPLLLLLLLGSIIGMILSRLLPLKFFSRYEILFSITSPPSLLLNTTTNEMLLSVYPIRNPTFEVSTALSVSLAELSWIIYFKGNILYAIRYEAGRRITR